MTRRPLLNCQIDALLDLGSGRIRPRVLKSLRRRGLIYLYGDQKVDYWRLTELGVKAWSRETRIRNKPPVKFPLLKPRETEHIEKSAPRWGIPIRELRAAVRVCVRDFHLGNGVAALKSVEWLRRVHQDIPDDFYDDAEEVLERMYVCAAAKRLAGDF